jgi:hypothetical protein
MQLGPDILTCNMLAVGHLFLTLTMHNATHTNICVICSIRIDSLA